MEKRLATSRIQVGAIVIGIPKRRLIVRIFLLFFALALTLAFTAAPLVQASEDNPTDGWTKHNIDTSLDGAWGVYVYDVDTDGNPV